MCTAECEVFFKYNIDVIIKIFKATLKQDAEKLVSCFYACFKEEFIKRALIIYTGYPKDFIEFTSGTSFTNSILLFTKKAIANEIYNGHVTVKPMLLDFYMTTLRQNLQTEKRLAAKKVKYTIGYKE